MTTRKVKTRKRTWVTAEELMAELNADPGFVARQREREQALLRKDAELSRAEAPLIDALENVGVRVQSAWDLIGTPYPTTTVLPILIEHLRRPYPERVREGIARALAVPAAIKEWNTLLRLFETEADTTTTGAKWALACALSAAARDDVIEDLIRLIHDRRHGENRIALVSGLAKSTDPRALQALTEAGADPELATEVKRVLEHPRRKKAVVAEKVRIDEVANELSEASTSFESSQVEPFLKRAAALVSGFGPREIAQVTQLLDELEVDEERVLDFEVIQDGHPVPLRIVVFMDDVDAPDLSFLTTPKLADELEELMGDFSEEHGI